MAKKSYKQTGYNLNLLIIDYLINENYYEKNYFIYWSFDILP